VSRKPTGHPAGTGGATPPNHSTPFQLGEVPILGLRIRALAVCLAVAASLTALIPASADQVSPLAAQRQALQQQVNGLGGDKAKATADVLAAQDALNNLQRELQANAALLADLESQQSSIQGKIVNTEHDLAGQRALIAELTRSQYKHDTGDNAVEMIFSSGSFEEMLTRVMAEITVQRRIADTARRIKAEQAQFKTMSAQLAQKHQQGQLVQAQLERANGQQLALVADYDQRVARLDQQSRALLSQVDSINAQIAAAQAPQIAAAQAPQIAAAQAPQIAVAQAPQIAAAQAPQMRSPSFGPGSGSVTGGSSCGNHFSYGYCTWYVANRRCIPWFGNAWEWYGQAQAYGYPVGSQARVGAVAVWDQRMSSYGHVAYVESVQSDGFTVSEMNYNAWGQVNSRFVPYSNPGPLTGFIYAK
jgi:surface antigen